MLINQQWRTDSHRILSEKMVSRKVPRRQFILDSAGLILSSAPLLLPSSQLISLQERKPERSKILVMVHLAGGNDGLNTVIPYGFGQYYSARPSLAIPAASVLPITNAIGFNPSMSSLYDIYRHGHLAVLLGVGYPNASRSHFRSTSIWQTAEPDRVIDTSWLSRYLDHVHSKGGTQTQRISRTIDVDLIHKPMQETSMAFSQVDLDTLTSHNDIHYQLGNAKEIETSINAPDLEKSDANALKDDLKARQFSDQLTNLSNKYRHRIQYQNNRFARGLKFIAQMIVSGFNRQIYNISLGGFDTHANQAQTHPNLLKQLSDALAAFQSDLCRHKADKDVLVLVFSEFGRRLSENIEAGTDHGTAASVLVMGSAVKGGLYGDHPSLSDLDEGDLEYGIDFRTIYATILNRWLNADSKQILGHNFENISFI